jgi:hypothetical protein
LMVEIYSTSFNIIQHHSTSFNIIQHHSTSFNIIQHHSTSFNIIQHHSTSGFKFNVLAGYWLGTGIAIGKSKLTDICVM